MIGKTQGWDDRGQSKASDPDHLEESRGQALLLRLFLDQGWDRPTASMRVLGRAGWERALSVNPALYFRMDLIQKTKLPLPPPKPSPVPSVPGYIWPFGRGSQGRNQTSRMSGCFRTLTPSVCLSVLFFSVPTHWKHNFPLSLSFPHCWTTGPFYSSLGQSRGNVNSWGCGMQDRLAQRTGKGPGWVKSAPSRN